MIKCSTIKDRRWLVVLSEVAINSQSLPLFPDVFFLFLFFCAYFLSACAKRCSQMISFLTQLFLHFVQNWSLKCKHFQMRCGSWNVPLVSPLPYDLVDVELCVSVIPKREWLQEQGWRKSCLSLASYQDLSHFGFLTWWLLEVHGKLHINFGW